MTKRKSSIRRSAGGTRLLSLVLALCMTAGLLLPAAPQAQAASWMDPYLEQMVDWGVMRGDQAGSLDPERKITRAEFVAMVNRAYGYTEMRENPFEDIKPSDWFYEDIGIGYSAGYFKGTSTTSYIASPNSTLTREEAAVIVGRNMMLEEGVGEVLAFSDSRQFEEWSRHMIEAVCEEGIVGGDSSGAFRPKDAIKRGEVAAMLSRAVGTRVNEAGEQSLGGVYGNVTITEDGVTLKDTVIKGNLYISGGVGLGGVDLQNVTVMGKIVVAGSGESHRGGHSVVLRNVTADELVLDSPNDQFVTMKAEGLTNIAEANVRTGAYLEDVTEDGLGLQKVFLDGAEGSVFQLAGNIKDVVNLTPGSVVTMAQGVADSITIDEAALDSTLDIVNKATVSVLNLDTATEVTGQGDIDQLNVNAPGSKVEMLPDKITIRPGITAEINGEEMNSNDAAEASEDPRILSGYPVARNIAPTAADVVFRTNKKGTIYWALTAMADGTVGEEDLISPPVYSAKIVKSGTISAAASETDYLAKLSGLISNGSYYVSAMLVDNRGMRSPVKFTAFTTPDNTVPAFNSGYPYTIIANGADEKEQILQVMAMTNKDCQMYYALFPSGSAAPTAADFKANALSGNLGYGVVDMKKNTPFLVSRVNSVYLKEETDYDLYLWLTDVDGMNSSAVKKLTIKTGDRTAPRIISLSDRDATANTVKMSVSLSEPGSLYWAVVKEGTDFFRSDVTGREPDADGKLSKEAMLQIESGLNALQKSSPAVSVNKGQTEVEFTISGLEPQTAYDLYYVAKDKAGNYCIYDTKVIPLPMTIYTKDTEAPTVRQEFTHQSTANTAHPEPYPDTNIKLVFSENVQGMPYLDEDGDTTRKFLELYDESKTDPSKAEALGEALAKHIKLYVQGENAPVTVRNKSNESAVNASGEWVVDFRKARVTLDPAGSGELTITLPYNADPTKSALNLTGGVTYYFRLDYIADLAKPNYLEPLEYRLPAFTTVSAQILLKESYEKVPAAHDPEKQGVTDKWYFDLVFSAEPMSHDTMDEDIMWDLIVWSNQTITFKVYESMNGGTTWSPLTTKNPDGTETPAVGSIYTTRGDWYGVSIGTQMRNKGFTALRDLKDRLYAIEILSIGPADKRENFNVPVTVEVTAVSGIEGALGNVGDQLKTGGLYAELIENNNQVTDITAPQSYNRPDGFYLTKPFVDNTPPNFTAGFPRFTAGTSSVNMSVALDRLNATYYYLLAPLGTFETVVDIGTAQSVKIETEADWTNLPQSGSATETMALADIPTSTYVMTYRSTQADVARSGNRVYTGSSTPFNVDQLQPNTKYIAYFVLQGESKDAFSPQAYVFRFETGNIPKPQIQLTDDSPDVGVRTSEEADVSWFIMDMLSIDRTFLNSPFHEEVDGYSTDEGKQGETYKNFKSDYTNWDSMTVLQALTTSISANDHTSVFDKYAGSAIYTKVYQAVVESTGSVQRRDYGSTRTLKANISDAWARTEGPVSPEMDVYPAQYYFVCGARNRLSNNNNDYAFKAIAYIHESDDSAPSAGKPSTAITSAKYMGSVYTDPGQIYNPAINQQPAWASYTGSVSVRFSEQIHCYETINGVPGKTLITETNAKDYVGITKGTLDKVAVSGNEFTVHFKDLLQGGTITFFKKGAVTDESGNVHKVDGSAAYLVLRFVPQLAEEGKSISIEFEMEWMSTVS